MVSSPLVKASLQEENHVIRRDFPLFDNASKFSTLHYLDNAATSQKPKQVIQSISDCYEYYNAPIHRGLYELAEDATEAYESSRSKIAKFIGSKNSDQLIFTRSATESINMVAQGWLKHNLQKGEKVWVTAMEHHANLIPWQRVCNEIGAELCFLELTEEGDINLEASPELFSSKTRFIALTHVSNVLGVINPVKEICSLAIQKNIPVLIDATQSVGHMMIDVEDLGCDFLAFSAHKMYGPSGIGGLYGRYDKLNEVEPTLVGGGMVDEVEDNKSSWSLLPAKLEAGSPNLAGAIGFSNAVDYIENIGLDNMQSIVSKLTTRAINELSNIDGIKIYGPSDPLKRKSIISFNIEGVHPHDVSQIAGENNVAIRSGHHCCQPLMKRLDEMAVVRVSFAPYNLDEDIDALIETIKISQNIFKRS